jgi:hypothetical protein
MCTGGRSSRWHVRLCPQEHSWVRPFPRRRTFYTRLGSMLSVRVVRSSHSLHLPSAKSANILQCSQALLDLRSAQKCPRVLEDICKFCRCRPLFYCHVLAHGKRRFHCRVVWALRKSVGLRVHSVVRSSTAWSVMGDLNSPCYRPHQDVV